MSNRRGFVMVPRRIILLLAEKGFAVLGFFVWLVCRATIRDIKYSRVYRCSLDRGQVRLSMRELSSRYKLGNPKRVKRLLKACGSAVESDSDTRGTTVTIKNFDDYSGNAEVTNDDSCTVIEKALIALAREE
jgi:hypothetical protein